MFTYKVRLRRANGGLTEMKAEGITERETAIMVLRRRCATGDQVEVVTELGDLPVGSCDVTTRAYAAPEVPASTPRPAPRPAAPVAPVLRQPALREPELAPLPQAPDPQPSSAVAARRRAAALASLPVLPAGSVSEQVPAQVRDRGARGLDVFFGPRSEPDDQDAAADADDAQQRTTRRVSVPSINTIMREQLGASS